MIKRKVILIFTFILCSVYIINSQTIIKKSNKQMDPGFIIGFSYGYNISLGDMSSRFGNNFKVDISPTYYFTNSNIAIGLEASYIFGSGVKENTLSNLLSYDQQILNNNNSFSNLHLSGRGYLLGGTISKIISFNQNRRSGLKIELGSYLFRHWIHFRNDTGIVPQVQSNSEYIKGYDRLSGGVSFKEFVGYQYLKQDSRLSFYVGMEFIQGFTKNLRKFNFNTAEYDKKNRNDYLLGFKLGWILPLYIVKNPEEIYY